MKNMIHGTAHLTHKKPFSTPHFKRLSRFYFQECQHHQNPKLCQSNKFKIQALFHWFAFAFLIQGITQDLLSDIWLIKCLFLPAC